MGNITTMAVFVWTINILLFLAQASMIAINPESINFYSTDQGLLSDFSTGGNLTMPDESTVSSQINPESSSELSESGSGTGIFFIDAIASVKNWVQSKLAYFTAIVMAPYNVLNATGLPPQFTGAISLLWYGVSILLIVLVIFGRQD